MSGTHWIKQTNYSNGYIVEWGPIAYPACESWLLLPAENLWSVGIRGFLYILAMLYIFLGIAIASDVFMTSIEVITSKKRIVVRWDEERQERVEKEVLIWNETVANLTLMGLGSSAPEILLACIDTITNLIQGTVSKGLGTFTIIGSAAFNLLIITSVCIASVSAPNVKNIRELGVFVLTSIWSIFAYIWILVTLVWSSPGRITVWEAWITLAFFPVLVITAYCQDNGWWCKKATTVGVDFQSQTNIRVITDKRKPSVFVHGPSKELHALEAEKANRRGSRDMETSSTCSQARLVKVRPNSATAQTFARARFRHAAVRSMLGGKKQKAHIAAPKPKMTEVVDEVRKTHQGHFADEDVCGKFTFAAPSYSVLESAGILEIDILFHRRRPVAGGAKGKLLNGKANGKENETSFSNGLGGELVYTGVVAVEYETREGSAKLNKDFKYTQGTLIFKETEYRKTISIPIINDDQYENDVDFYVLLKNAKGDCSLGDPSVTRVTIIDDDEPGEFLFEEPHYYADVSSGIVSAIVMRQKGCDGTVTIEYTTIDGTAKGGERLSKEADYICDTGTLTFKHGETSKPISIKVSKNTKGSKNFIIALKNPSLGARIGKHSATVANITTDDIAERIADILDDDDDEDDSWSGQFKNAMSLSEDKDADGQKVALKWYDYLLHFLTFFWKVSLACIPPTKYLGAWPTFVFSLAAIAVMTAVVEQLGTLLGCVLSLKASVAGITIVALGTSLPDLFASRTAALHDEHADAAIGNITGSNSVNVFLGLGLPWVISSMYHVVKNTEYKVSTTQLVSSVVIFTICGTLCIIMLLIRRWTVGGELGGKNVPVKVLCSSLLAFLWFIYVLLVSLQAYYPQWFPWS